MIVDVRPPRLFRQVSRVLEGGSSAPQVTSTTVGHRDHLEHGMSTDRDESIIGVSSLAEPQRRALYRFVVDRGQPVGKDEAAEALGIARTVAGFHLDRLVADGLLTTEFRRLTGRQGPGAGRPAKLYRRAPGELSVSLPP